jgi:hypothetical protein
VTVKDQFNVKGHDSTIGYVSRSFSPAAEDAVLVQILRDMGAVIFAKSNLPQSIMVCSSGKKKVDDTFMLGLTKSSGLKQRILSGVSQLTLGALILRLVALREVKLSCSHCTAPYLGLGRISVVAFGYHKASWVPTASNLVYVGNHIIMLEMSSKLELEQQISLRRSPCFNRRTRTCPIFCWSHGPRSLLYMLFEPPCS